MNTFTFYFEYNLNRNTSRYCNLSRNGVEHGKAQIYRNCQDYELCALWPMSSYKLHAYEFWWKLSEFMHFFIRHHHQCNSINIAFSFVYVNELRTLLFYLLPALFSIKKCIDMFGISIIYVEDESDGAVKPWGHIINIIVYRDGAHQAASAQQLVQQKHQRQLLAVHLHNFTDDSSDLTSPRWWLALRLALIDAYSTICFHFNKLQNRNQNLQ